MTTRRTANSQGPIHPGALEPVVQRRFEIRLILA